jgi:RNA polymerase sigma-70 factor, ECF subfamily
MQTSRTAGRDVAAFAILVARYDRKIFRIAFAIAQNREDAQDVVQEAFLRAFAKLRQFSGNSSFYTWLVSITVNQALMKLRSQRRVKLCSLEGEDEFALNVLEQIPQQSIPNPEQLCYTSELNRLLTKSLARLSPRLRAVFVLRDVEGLSMIETAETLNITVAAVKARLFRARHLLRKQLSKYFQHGHSPLGGGYGQRFGASAGI